MTEHEELKRRIEDVVRLKQELFRTLREISDLKRLMDYIDDNNLEYCDTEIRLRITYSDLHNLICARKRKVEVLKDFIGE